MHRLSAREVGVVELAIRGLTNEGIARSLDLCVGTVNTYWMQAIPGVNNGLTYRGKKLRNWWTFVFDWDKARAEKWTLVMP